MTDTQQGSQALPPAPRNRRLTILVVVLVLCGLAYWTYRIVTWNPNYVVEVFDANQMKLKSGDHVELIGLQCLPRDDNALGAEAHRYVSSLVVNHYIRIETDQQERSAGNWILGYVFARQGDNEIFLNRELLLRGYARHRPEFPNVKYRKEFDAAEAEAKKNRVGRWSPDFKEPGQ